MLSPELIQAGQAVDARQATIIALLQAFGEAPLWEKGTLATDLSREIFTSMALRERYADLLEAEISALDDRLRALEASSGE